MSTLSPLVLKRNAFRAFASDVDGGVGHAYLFLSEDALVREEFLTLAAKKIFCPSICDSCPDCINVEGHNHLDAHFFDGAELKVKQITELTESASVRPLTGDKKVYLIDNADKLSPQAQNKLLKTYEEPPAYVTVVLAASGENGILPTIRSRAKKLYFDGLTASEIISLLTKEGASDASAGIAAALASGSLERAELFLSNDNYADVYDGCFELLSELNSSSRICEYLYSPLFTKENVLMTFDFLEIILDDVMKIVSGSGSELRNANREYDLKQIALKYTAQSAAMALYAVNEGRRKLNANVNSVTAAEAVMFDILEARYKWQL